VEARHDVEVPRQRAENSSSGIEAMSPAGSDFQAVVAEFGEHWDDFFQ